MSDPQIDAILYTLAMISHHDCAEKSLLVLEKAFDIKFDFVWCGACCSYVRQDHDHYGKKRK